MFCMKNHKLYRCLIIRRAVLLFSVFLMLEVNAATNQKTGFEKLIAQADVIAVGKYTDVASAWDKKKIYTTATLQVENIVKGDAGSIIKIKVLGGTAIHPRLNTPISMNVSNSAKFIVGSSAVVFLKKNNEDTYQIVGMSKGNVTVSTDEEGERYMGGGIKKIAASKNENTGNTIIHHEKMKLEQFVTYIHSLLQESK